MFPHSIVSQFDHTIISTEIEPGNLQGFCLRLNHQHNQMQDSEKLNIISSPGNFSSFPFGRDKPGSQFLSMQQMIHNDSRKRIHLVLWNPTDYRMLYLEKKKKKKGPLGYAAR